MAKVIAVVLYPVALFATASISEPTKRNADHPPFENNTFVIAIQLEVLKK